MHDPKEGLIAVHESYIDDQCLELFNKVGFNFKTDNKNYVINATLRSSRDYRLDYLNFILLHGYDLICS